MTLLDDIIEGSTDDSVSTANLLRKVQIASSRVGAEPIVNWARGELNGYDPQHPELLPEYRYRIALPVHGHFEGPFGSSARGVKLSSYGTSAEFAEIWFNVDLPQPLAELERLANASGKGEPQFPWAPEAVQLYRQWAAEGKVMRMEMMELFGAALVFPRTSIHGLIEQVRNKALEFALEMQNADPDAGSPGGPTIDEPKIESAVHNTTFNIYGHGNNVASGSEIKQKSTVAVGDVAALTEAARNLGLDEGAIHEFVELVQEERSLETPRAVRFLESVRSGAISLGGNVTANLAASGLMEIAGQFLGR